MQRAATLASEHADALGDEGHGARGARIDLDHVDLVHPAIANCTFIRPDDAQRQRHLPHLLAHLVLHRRGRL
jgi:hypothetical protein